jgi:hypothetical protein
MSGVENVGEKEMTDLDTMDVEFYFSYLLGSVRGLIGGKVSGGGMAGSMEGFALVVAWECGCDTQAQSFS